MMDETKFLKYLDEFEVSADEHPHKLMRAAMLDVIQAIRRDVKKGMFEPICEEDFGKYYE